jgi:hypothetical protein
MLLLRKIVFYILAAVYLVLCPLMVARMLGFVIHPQTHRWVRTGLVYVTTTPPDATLYVDGRRAPQKTPTAVRDLVRGDHFVRIELNGYNDWKSYVTIVGKKATLVNVNLVAQKEPN